MGTNIYGPYSINRSVIAAENVVPDFRKGDIRPDRPGNVFTWHNQSFFACNDKSQPGCGEFCSRLGHQLRLPPRQQRDGPHPAGLHRRITNTGRTASSGGSAESPWPMCASSPLKVRRGCSVRRPLPRPAIRRTISATISTAARRRRFWNSPRRKAGGHGNCRRRRHSAVSAS